MAAPLHSGGDIIGGRRIGGFFGGGGGCCGRFISASHTESALGEDDDQGLPVLERSISAALDSSPIPPPTDGGEDDDFSHGSSNHDYF